MLWLLSCDHLRVWYRHYLITALPEAEWGNSWHFQRAHVCIIWSQSRQTDNPKLLWCLSLCLCRRLPPWMMVRNEMWWILSPSLQVCVCACLCEADCTQFESRAEVFSTSLLRNSGHYGKSPSDWILWDLGAWMEPNISTGFNGTSDTRCPRCLHLRLDVLIYQLTFILNIKWDESHLSWD